MSAEQNVSELSKTTSAATYPSTSLPPVPEFESVLSTNNGAQTENGTYSLAPMSNSSSPVNTISDPVGSIAVIPTSGIDFYPTKVSTSNGQARKGSNSSHPNHNSNPNSIDQAKLVDPHTPATSQQLNNEHHPLEFPSNVNQGDGSNEPMSSTTPPNVYKAQITTASIGKDFNGGEKTEQVETPIVVTNPKGTKTSQPRNRTPAKNRQKAANANGEPRPSRAGAQNSTTSVPGNPAQSSGSQPTGTKRPHPNQYTYQSSTVSKDNRGTAAYSRYSTAVPAPSSQIHHGAQQVQYSIPAGSNYSSPKIYVQSQGPSSVSSPYSLHQRPGATQRASVSTGSSSPQVIIQCRPDQQSYPHSQNQASNQHFIIQTQQTSDQSPAVYQQRSGVGGRPEIQRQYIQTIPSGGPNQASVSGQGQQSSGQPQVLHIQLHHSDMSGQQKLLIQQQTPSGAVQQQLIDKRQIPNGPQQQQIGADPQMISTLSDKQGPSSSSSGILHHIPSTAQQSFPRGKNVRTLIAQPQMAIKTDDLFDDDSMHPPNLPLPDSFNTILDQIHASGESPKTYYRRAKKQFKYLENEYYQEEVRNSQRHLLKLSRDTNFLLDKLLSYESGEEPSDESDADSDVTIEEKPKPKKKKSQLPRKRNPAPSAGKKPNAKTKPQDEDNSQGSVDSSLASNSQNPAAFASFQSAPSSQQTG